MDPCSENVKPIRRSKEEKKVLRKQIKASHILLKHEAISTVSQPTKSLVVANGGLGNGVSREQLSALLKEGGEVETLVMHPHKPYALITYRSEVSAQRAHALLNGRQLQCGGDQSVTLYLSYIKTVGSEADVCVSLPAGLVLVEDFVSPEEEALLLDAIDWTSPNEDDTAQKALKHRRVKHYGYEFRYDNNNVDKDKPLAGGLPQECIPVLERCVRDGHVDVLPDQLTVNQYQSGQGIPPHVDTHSAFEDTILSLSLGAKTVMEFRHPDGRLVAVVLPGRSLLMMKGESRYLWTHGITPRKFDVVPADYPESPATVTSDLSNHSNLTLSRRGTRTSFTFRKVRRTPCDCAFLSPCDSQQPSAPSPPSLPSNESDAARLEAKFVHRSFLADVGCGNGKYLGVNPEVIAVGCDRSSALVQICSERGFQAFVSDALSVPLRKESCDACISIAVIHHFSTQERRLAAVKELVRLLKPGGRALIYVWALEQNYNKQRSKYLREPIAHRPESNSIGHYNQGREGPTGNGKDYNQEEARSENPLDNNLDCNQVQARSENPLDNNLDCNQVPSGKESPPKLRVHTNRTAFDSQDLLVPWHLKGGGGERAGGETGGGNQGKGVGKQGGQGGSKKTSDLSTTNVHGSAPSPGPVFHRYYHVFQEGELEELCGRVRGVSLQSSYHDQGNWCVILEKAAGDR